MVTANAAVIGGCATCTFMVEKGTRTLATKCDGWCHRYPPVPAGGGTSFPLIRNIDDPMNKCGEYILDPEKKKAVTPKTA